MLIAVGILVNFGIMLWAVLTWPDYAILAITIAPLIVTPIYCLITSAYTKKKETVSPVYLMVFNSFVAVIVTGIRYHNITGEELIAYLFAMAVLYFFWIMISPYFQLLIRFLIGAYGKVDPLEKNVISFEISKRPEDIVFRIKEEWLGLLAGMKVKENRSKKQILKLRLQKLGTNLYLAFYGELTEKKRRSSLLNIVPYAISENLRRKDIVSNKEIREFMAPQIEQIEKKLSLVKYRPASSPPLIPETIEYALYPARFPIDKIREHKTELSVIIFSAVLIMALTSLRVANIISETLFVGFCGISVSFAIAVVGFLIRK